MADVYQLDTGPKGGHWHALQPSRNLARRMTVCLIVGLLWELMTIVVGLSRLSSPHSALTVVVFVAFLALGMLPLLEAARVFLMYRHLDDAKVSVDRRELVIGLSFNVKVEQGARRGLKIKDMRIALVCVEESPQSGPNGRKEARQLTRVEKWEKLTSNKTIDHEKVLSATRKFHIPPEQLPSSPATKTEPPHVRWKLRLVTAPVHGPAYDVEFPVKVYATPSGPSWG